MMRKVFACHIVLLLFPALACAQLRRMEQNPSLDNLVHSKDYKPCELGSLGNVAKTGNGPRDMILIAGAGFGGDVFDAFMMSRKEEFRIYAVTLPGFGGTTAPPMPKKDTSYGERTWHNGARRALERLIEVHELKRPVIVAHWCSATQVAVDLALENPKAVSAVVIISGVAENVATDIQLGATPTPKQRVDIIDKSLAPQWFKTVTRDTWDDNNFYPHDYARSPIRALQLWRQAFQPTLPVWIRYLCEAWSYDLTLSLDRLEVPMLILKPGFDADHWSPPGPKFMQAYCHDSWKGVEKRSELITVQTIPDSRVFIMDDQLASLNAAVSTFLTRIDRN